MEPQRIPPGPGQESVWDYPQPPRLEETSRLVRVLCGGVVVAQTRRAKRMLEKGHPPVYYIPAEDARLDLLAPNGKHTLCEYKGQAEYFDLRVGAETVHSAAWSYAEPAASYATIRGHLAFYPHRMDACYVDDEQVQPQQGRFYGGWITSEIVGPFKGGSTARDQ